MAGAETRRIVAADIGGTHARFAFAEIAGGEVVSLGEPVTLRTAEHAGLAEAWQTFLGGCEAPREAAIAIAAPIGDEIALTNADWIIRSADLPHMLGLDRVTLLNDFGAVGHAVAALPERWFAPLCGPPVALPAEGVISVIGPGTGLGVAQLVRRGDGYQVIETEGGHIGFAPTDPIEDAILAGVRARYGRVSAERLASGSGLIAIYETLAEISTTVDQVALWSLALAGGDAAAEAALDRFCRCLGAIAGDVALAHGARGVVIAGGLGLRMADHLPHSSFVSRFVAKGRFAKHMAKLPVRLLLHPEPGLFGAAAAHAAERGTID